MDELKQKLGAEIRKAFRYHSYVLKYELQQILIKDIKFGFIPDITVDEIQNMKFNELKHIVDQLNLKIDINIKNYFAYYDANFTQYPVEDSINFLQEMLFEFF